MNARGSKTVPDFSNVSETLLSNSTDLFMHLSNSTHYKALFAFNKVYANLVLLNSSLNSALYVKIK